LVHEEYEREAARLRSMTRAQRFEELIEFPTRHMIKAIGKQDEVGPEVQRVLATLGFEGLVPVERQSAKGRYVSITFELQVESGAQLDEIYTALEQVPSVRYLF